MQLLRFVYVLKRFLGHFLAILEEHGSQWEPFGAIFEICECSEALLGTLLGDFGSKREPCEPFETAPGDDPARCRAIPRDAAQSREHLGASFGHHRPLSTEQLL